MYSIMYDNRAWILFRPDWEKGKMYGAKYKDMYSGNYIGNRHDVGKDEASFR